MRLYPLNKIFLLKIAVCVLFLFCFQIVNVSAHESVEENAVTIHMSEKGFEPSKIKVKIGTKVIFENTSTEDRWPASDDHPSHTLYDGTSLEEHCASHNSTSFDACKPIPSGQSWSFVFEKAGTYSLHDHLWPQYKGEINIGRSIFQIILDCLKKIFIIKPKESTALKSGATNTQFYTDLKNRFEKIVTDQDPDEAIHVLKEESLENSQTMSLCHDMLHVIGHTAYDKYGSFKEAVKFQEDFCNSGYIHGLFEAYFKSAEDPLANLSAQCNEYGAGKRPFDLWQCHHGIGHGFMYLTGGDLDASLKLCSDGLKGNEAIESCQNGVYMEVFNLEILAKEKEFVNPENPFLTCSTRKTAKNDCYVYIPTYLSQTSGKDFSTILKECEKAETGYKSTCIRGVGTEAIKRNMNNPANVFSICKEAGSYLDQESCVSGIVSMYMNQEGSLSAGQKLCEITPKEYRDMCTRTVQSRESFFTVSK